MDLAGTIVFLIRLGINPAATLAAFSNRPFGNLRGTSDREIVVVPVEIWPHEFPLKTKNTILTAKRLEWVRKRWQLTHQLKRNSSEFALAVAAINTGQFINNSALTLVSLWGALEALFSPSTTELKFRISALIASFLERPGRPRSELQKEIGKLYDKRSAAAHGKPRHDEGDVLDTFNLLRRVLHAIIDNQSVPTKDELEARLFGA
jgi:hypothetical protein